LFLWKGIFICNFNTLFPIIPSLQLPLHQELYKKEWKSRVMCRTLSRLANSLKQCLQRHQYKHYEWKRTLKCCAGSHFERKVWRPFSCNWFRKYRDTISIWKLLVGKFSVLYAQFTAMPESPINSEKIKFLYSHG
jgi:hypothetical protein